MQHLDPTQAWAFIQSSPNTIFVDVRMEIESLYVGRPPGVISIPWYEYPEFTPNAANFVHQVLIEAQHDLARPVVLLCRSGSRTLDAGTALMQAGFTQVINIVHGFEGDLNANDHRSSVNGWRFAGLPWVQM
jgi:rhodanese-related sulfurtransferase